MTMQGISRFQWLLREVSRPSGFYNVKLGEEDLFLKITL